MLVEGCGRFNGNSNDDVAMRRNGGGGGAVGHGGLRGCVLDVYHLVLRRRYGGPNTAGIGGSVQDLRIPTAAALTDFEDGARFFVGERAQKSELVRRANLLGELNVDAGERGEREAGSWEEKDGQLTKGGRGRKSECALRGRDDGGGGDQDGARGQQDTEEGRRRRGHFGWGCFLFLFKVLDNRGDSSRIETEDGDWGGTLLFARCICVFFRKVGSGMR